MPVGSLFGFATSKVPFINSLKGVKSFMATFSAPIGTAESSGKSPNSSPNCSFAHPPAPAMSRFYIFTTSAAYEVQDIYGLDEPNGLDCVVCLSDGGGGGGGSLT
jgi:hypothetical protein